MSTAGRVLGTFGVKPRQAAKGVTGLPKFLKELREVRRLVRIEGMGKDFPLGSLYPVIGEDSQESGTASGHYFHQDLYVAQKIFAARPRHHTDVGSRVDGFVAHVAAFRQVEVLDLRALDVKVPNIEFVQSDVMDTHSLPESHTDSLSCLHALEHFGLGRYGDRLDLDGWRKGLISLNRLLESGGTLYLSVPTSRHQRIEFNAHRVFSIPFLREELLQYFDLADFAGGEDEAVDVGRGGGIGRSHLAPGAGDGEAHREDATFELSTEP